MATSLIGGLLSSSTKTDQILVAEPDADKRRELEKQFGIQTTSDNTTTLDSDAVILAVKPQLLQSVCNELAASTSGNQPLFISIAAGVRSTDINRWLGNNRAIVRSMPNTPALVAAGATALFNNENVSEAQKMLAENILQAVGITLWVIDESKLDAVTAVSGSGPAYFFLLMEAVQEAGEDLGLDPGTAQTLTLQTALGAALMANKSDVNSAALRSQVTSKGGTTEQAINSLENAGFRHIVKQALVAAFNRSEQLADELGKDNA